VGGGNTLVTVPTPAPEGPSPRRRGKHPGDAVDERKGGTANEGKLRARWKLWQLFQPGWLAKYSLDKFSLQAIDIWFVWPKRSRRSRMSMPCTISDPVHSLVPSPPSCDADYDEAARVKRYDVARDSGMMPPTVTE